MRVPKIKGVDLGNVFILRTSQDQEKIKDIIGTVKNVAVVGASFIGSESASSIKLKYKENINVHLITNDEFPLEKALGKEIGALMKSEHEKHGVKVHTENGLKEIKGENGKVKSIVLNDSTEIPVDLVLLGTGIAPATDFLASAVEKDKVGAIICDPFMQTSDKDIFAAGDIASFPYWQTGERVRIEHYVVALDQGSHAAFNMLGKMAPYGNIPFFWTRNYNKSL